jgi:uncharacterized YccA/Bax inhibitor family protein
MPQNPVLNKFGQVSRSGPRDVAPGELETMFAQPAYTGPRTTTRYMTLDDVVQRTGAMLLTVLVAGGLAWAVVPTRAAGAVLLVGGLSALGVGLYMSFTLRVNAALALTYAALEGAALGTISRLFNHAYPGIVIQAVTGTVAVALGMLFVYRIGAIRVTPKFTRVVVGATLGVFGLMVINGLAYLFHPGGLGLRTGGAAAIVFSLICIVIAAMNLVVDFDMVERGIRQGADERFAWFAAFGLTVTLVWLYLEILRLLSYFRE